jgi:hypothetical protein
MTCQISNGEFINQANFTNMKINYDIISDFSNDTTTSFGQSIGFSGIDNWQSFQYNPVGTASTAGLGEINNLLVPTAFATTNGYLANGVSNQARLKRMLDNTSYDPVNSTSSASSFFNGSTQSGVLGKNYCASSNSTSQITYHILATIPLSILHDLFYSVPLTKGLFMRLTLNLNTNCSVSLTTTATPTFSTAYTVQVSSNGTLPFQISQIGTGGMAIPAAATALTATLGIAKSYGNVTAVSHALSQCRLYVPAYQMTAESESNYIKSTPQKTFYYKDFYSFASNALSVTPGSTINPSLNISVPRLRGLLIIPQLSASVHGNSVANLSTSAGGTLGSPLLSPFSSSPGTCAPWGRVSNFNVFIGGTPVYQQNISYGFEHFYNEVRKDGSAYGNMMRTISSGLIGQSDWEAGYGFIYTNLERCENEAVDNASKVVSFQLTNASTYTCDYYCFLIYERSGTLSTTTGQLIVV